LGESLSDNPIDLLSDNPIDLLSESLDNAEYDADSLVNKDIYNLISNSVLVNTQDNECSIEPDYLDKLYFKYQGYKKYQQLNKLSKSRISKYVFSLFGGTQ
jgi:hypothetical protein